jgi:citrate synthase
MIDFIFEKLTGKIPNKKQKLVLQKLFEEMWTFEEELEPPTSYVALLGASCGVGYHQAMASAINLFGEKHGPIGKAVAYIGRFRFHSAFILEGSSFYGFGHPKYKKQDPRTVRMVKFCKSIGYTNEYIKDCLADEKRNNRCLNIGGFMACVLLDCGCTPENADYFPLIARMLGLSKIYEKAKKKKIKLGDARKMYKLL